MAENDKSIFNVSDRSDPTPAAVDWSELERRFTSPQPQNPDIPTAPFEPPAAPPSAGQEFITGLKSGWSQVGTDLRATAAMSMAIVGAEKDALDLMQIVMNRQDQDEKDFPKTIQKVEDIQDISDFTKWAARSLGEQIPNIATMLVGGLGTRVLGSLIGRGAMSLGAAPQLVAKFPVIFDGLGVVGSSAALETGATASELFEATGKLQPEASFIAGITKGALESLTPMMLGARLGISTPIARDLSASVYRQFERIVPARLATAVGTGFSEGVTEALQEAVDIAARSFVDEHYDFLSEEARSRILNAAATGAFVGSVFGLAHRGNRRQTSMEEGTPVMPPAFNAGSADISVGDESTGLPAQIRLRPGADPATLPPLQIQETTQASRPESTVISPAPQPLQQEELSTQAAYDKTQPPGPTNKVADAKTPNTAVTAHDRVMHAGFAENSPALHENDFFQIAENPERVVTLDGKGYNHATDNKAGSATFIYDKKDPLAVKNLPLLRQMETFATQVLQRFGLKDKLVLFPGRMLLDNPTVSRLFKVGGFGQFAGFADGTSVIGVHVGEVNPQGLQNKRTAIFNVLSHELGHLIVARRFANAPPELKAKIIAQYESDLIKAVYGEGRFSGAFLNYDYMQYFGWDQRAKPGPTMSSNSSYRFSADEWFAEQISRYLSQDLMKTRTFIWNDTQRFFQSLANELRALYHMVRDYIGREVAPSVREWLDSMQKSRAWSFEKIAEAMEAKDKAGNTQVLDKYGAGEAIPPPQLASAGLGNLLTKLGISGSQVREVRAFADKFSWFMDLAFNIFQIGQHNPHIKPLQRYIELVDRWKSFVMNWMGRADETLRAWRSLGPKMSGNLARFLYAVDRMDYLTPAERAAGTIRLPTDGELAGLVTQHGLNAAAFQQYTRIRDDFRAVLDQIEATSLRDIERTLKDPVAKQDAIAELAREMKALRARPYFPHARFGNYAVVVKDKPGGKTVYMEQFETHRQANAAVAELLETAKRDFPNAVARSDYIPKEVHGFRGLPPNLIAKLREQLISPVKDEGLRNMMNQWLDNLMVDMAPSASFRHHLQKRMNTPGFSLNASRAYASYFFHAARHLARIEYGPLMQEEVTTGMNQSITGLENPTIAVDVAKRRRIQEYMANHLDHILNPAPDWHQLRSATFMWYLGYNVSSAALNLTQPVLVGAPYLAARFGDGKAVAALMKAVRDIQNVYKFRQQDRVPDSLLKALNRGIHEGVLEESQAAELSASAQGGYLSRLLPGTRLQRMAMMFSHYGGWLFQQSERLNRRIMFRAGWELAMKNPNTKYLNDLVATNTLAMNEMLEQGFDQLEARAYLAARDAVNQTQFRYGQEARPKFMRGPKGVIFTFFMFTQSMLHFARYSPGNTRYLAMMLLMAGLMGLPGAEDLEAIAKLLARNILGKEFDLKKEVRELVTGMFGDEIPPDLFLHGLGRVGFGLPALADLLGIPKAEFDFSRRVGLGRIIPGLAELGNPGTDFDQAMSRVSQQAAGATFGIGFNIVRALSDDQLPMGDFKRWERLMPTALSNMSKVLRYAQEGRERSRTDATIVDYNVTDPDHIAELALRAIGFQPTRVQREWDRISMQREAEAYWMGRRAIILKLWGHSFGMGDADLRESALDDVRSYNAEVPFGSMKITGEQLARSRKEHLRQIRLREAGLSQTKALRPLVQDIETLHPETRPVQVVDVETVR